MAKKCLFCDPDFIAGSLVGQTDYFNIIFDGNPVNPGHLLVIPKRHITTFFELNCEEHADLLVAIQIAKEKRHDGVIKKAYQRALAEPECKPKSKVMLEHALKHWNTPVTGYNLGINNGESAGQTVFHLHVHLIPRYDGDVANPVGGVRYVIPERGNYRE